MLSSTSCPLTFLKDRSGVSFDSLRRLIPSAIASASFGISFGTSDLYPSWGSSVNFLAFIAIWQRIAMPQGWVRKMTTLADVLWV